MSMKLMPITRKALAVMVALSMLLTACGTTVGTRSYYHHPTHVWYDYYYYPTLDIYLEIDSGYYWHRSHDHWVRVKHLPPRFNTHGHKREFLRLDIDQPYRQHKEHYKHYHPGQHEQSDAHKDMPRYASDLHRDKHQVRLSNPRRSEGNTHFNRPNETRSDDIKNVKIRSANTSNSQKLTKKRLDDKSQGIRPALKQRGSVRDVIPELKVNRPVDASLKQKHIQQRSTDKHLRGNGPRLSKRSESRKDTSKSALEGRNDRHRLMKENRRRSDEKASIDMKNLDYLHAHTEQRQ